METKDDKGNDNLISLKFRIQNETITIDKVNVNQPLSVSVSKALKDHSSGRPDSDWIVSFDGKQLDPSKKVKDLGLSDGDTLKLTLKDGGGGSK